MLRVVIRTETPEWCIAKSLNQATIIFKHIVLDGNCIKAIVSFKTSKGNKTVVIRDHECSLARAILESGAIVVSAEVRKDYVVWVLACTDEEFRDLLDGLDGLQIGYELLWKSSFFDNEDEINYKELEILRLALDLGFFENPKRIKLEDLAKILGMSKATASDLLRRALKKAVKKYITEYR